MTTALEGVRTQRHAPAVLYPGKTPVPIVREAGWTPGPVWTGAENLAPAGIRSPDRAARSVVTIPTELPGPPHYSGHIININLYIYTMKF